MAELKYIGKFSFYKKFSMVWNNWIDSFVEYIRNSHKYWGGKQERQNRKLIEIRKILSDKYQLVGDDYYDFIVDLAETRKEVPDKLYISNIGGSGSHWLSMMLEDILGWFDLGEVYLPPLFYQDIVNLENREIGMRFYDAVEMLHGFLYNLEVKFVPGANFINSAHSVDKIKFHRYLYPNSKIIHLVRDPRDRTLSITYRKNEWREEAHPEKSDHEYLIYNANRAKGHYYNYVSSQYKADYDVKYEDLQSNG